MRGAPNEWSKDQQMTYTPNGSPHRPMWPRPVLASMPRLSTKTSEVLLSFSSAHAELFLQYKRSIYSSMTLVVLP